LVSRLPKGEGPMQSNEEKENKRIDIVVKYFYPVAAGIETNILETYKVLVEKGWDVYVHTSNHEYTTDEILAENETVKGIRVIRYPLRGHTFDPELPYDSTGLICLHNFNIQPHLNIMLKSLWLKLIGRKRFSLVLTPHGGFNPEWRIFSPSEIAIKLPYHFTLGTLLINLVVDAVRAVSEWEKIEMVKKGVFSKKISVISNGIEDDAFKDIDYEATEDIKKLVDSWGDYLIQIGRVYPIKNYETTINALVDVPENIKYVIVGPTADEAYKDELKKLASSLGLKERLIFPGVIRGTDKYYVIKHAKAMVHMAIWESFCNVVHEAMSQGLPVIAADNTALSFLVKDGVSGYLVQTKDDQKVAEKINYILDGNNTEEVNKISETNIKHAKENSWANTAGQMDKLYNSLI
jgi:glycosyltransferase involved in cell wall biosynthesis